MRKIEKKSWISPIWTGIDYRSNIRQDAGTSGLRDIDCGRGDVLLLDEVIGAGDAKFMVKLEIGFAALSSQNSGASIS
jgi:hypothetical protein